jgi:hypothetical protein
MGVHVAQTKQEVSIKTIGAGSFYHCQYLDEEIGLETLLKIILPSMGRSRVKLCFVEL